MLNPSAGVWGLCIVAALRAFQERVSPAKYRELYGYLADAEFRGELSEFYALAIQATLAISEKSEFSTDYLEMAEAVTSSHIERGIIAEIRVTYDWLKSKPNAATECFQETLGDDCQAGELWGRLLVALCRLGGVEARTPRVLRGPQAA